MEGLTHSYLSLIYIVLHFLGFKNLIHSSFLRTKEIQTLDELKTL